MNYSSIERWSFDVVPHMDRFDDSWKPTTVLLIIEFGWESSLIKDSPKTTNRKRKTKINFLKK